MTCLNQTVNRHRRSRELCLHSRQPAVLQNIAFSCSALELPKDLPCPPHDTTFYCLRRQLRPATIFWPNCGLVYLSGTQVTDAGIDELKQALSGLAVKLQP